MDSRAVVFPIGTANGWPTSHLKSQEVYTSPVQLLFKQLDNRPHAIHSALLIKQHQIFIEEYFNNHSADKLHDLRSATKSILFLLRRIAIDKKLLQKCRQPYLKIFWHPKPHKILVSKKKK